MVPALICRHGMPTTTAKPDKGSAAGATGVSKAGELAEKGIELTAQGTSSADAQAEDNDVREAEDLVVCVSRIAFHACLFRLQSLQLPLCVPGRSLAGSRFSFVDAHPADVGDSNF
jgi:hypothetical protein